VVHSYNRFSNLETNFDAVTAADCRKREWNERVGCFHAGIRRCDCGGYRGTEQKQKRDCPQPINATGESLTIPWRWRFF
jgi:hypothetical protein